MARRVDRAGPIDLLSFFNKESKMRRQMYEYTDFPKPSNIGPRVLGCFIVVAIIVAITFSIWFIANRQPAATNEFSSWGFELRVPEGWETKPAVIGQTDAYKLLSKNYKDNRNGDGDILVWAFKNRYWGELDNSTFGFQKCLIISITLLNMQRKVIMNLWKTKD